MWAGGGEADMCMQSLGSTGMPQNLNPSYRFGPNGGAMRGLE